MGTPTFPIAAEVIPGDYGRDYARVAIGGREILIYQAGNDEPADYVVIEADSVDAGAAPVRTYIDEPTY